ncbi:MAG: PAS domain S-box protein [Elusimicrobia bacterium]|nr:PAS domain S-box protein [Elusimicrobiota bacterium]
MEEPQISLVDRRCLEAFKFLGKALGQMSLYKIGHPSVAVMLKSAEDQLNEVIAQTPGGEVSFIVDGQQLVANGRIVGQMQQLPSALTGVFARFKLNSITFKAGFSSEELAAFCELAASRPDGQATDPKAFLSGRGVSHVVLNEALYSKVVTAPKPTTPPAATGPAPAAAVSAAAAAEFQGKTLDETIQALIDKAVPDPQDRSAIYQQVMDLLKRDIQHRIDEITKTLRQEKHMLENEQSRTQTVLQNFAEGMIMVDEQGKILMMNQAAEQIYGSPLSQIVGQPLVDKTTEEAVITLAAEISTPKDRPVSKEVKLAGGEEVQRTLRSAGAVVQNESGKVVGMVSSLSDAAKYKEVQRMQREFVAHVTHELRAPLSSIRAALEIVQGEVRGKIDEEQDRMLTTALKNSDRLGEMINSILDFSKIESGQMTVYPKKADAEKIGRESVDSLAPWAVKKRITLSLTTDPELPAIMADSQRTIQVLINLISNAIKFTPVGGRISVSVRRSPGSPTSSSEKFIEFSVADTGCGIKREDHKKIFEKFVQIAAGDKHVGGTGLGLAIAKALVHLQAGRMWVESEEGKGATFIFTLPLYVPPKEPGATAPRAQAQPQRWWKRLLGIR